MAAKNGTSQPIIKDEEWDNLRKRLRSVIMIGGGLLFFPLVLLLGIAYGIKAGLLVTVEETLSMLKAWEP